MSISGNARGYICAFGEDMGLESRVDPGYPLASTALSGERRDGKLG